MQTYQIGFSPCPNDTFIFDSMVHGRVAAQQLAFEPILEDVETLNLWALEGKLPITKLSYSTFLKVSDQYKLLRTGSALGRGVGPLLISKKPLNDLIPIQEQLKDKTVAIPGLNTTANLLLSIAFPTLTQKTEIIFSDIEAKVLDGTYDLGLVIHESRFTYAEKGLHCWQDMGNWWEQYSEAAIPLGGICVRKDVPLKDMLHIEELIAKSVQLSWEQYPTLAEYVKDHAQVMDESVMRKHIELYVNEYSNNLGIVGEQAITKLAEAAQKIGWSDNIDVKNLFV